MALELYKPDEATRSRGLLGVCLAAILFYGLFSLHEYLAFGFWQDDLLGGRLGDEFPISPRILLVAALLIGTSVGTYVLFNHPKIVDFLADTEKEMQNVSWAPRHEVVSSSIVVIITVIILAVYLGLVDAGMVALRDQVPWDAFWDRILGAS